MGLLSKIKETLGEGEKEELAIELSEAEEVFREKKASEIQEAEEEASRYIEQTLPLVEALEDALEELKEYEDKKGIQAVEDVAENFYRSRKKIVNNFEASEDIETHFERLEDMIEDFNDVSMKEGAVMNRVHKNSGNLSNRIEAVVEHRDEIEEFLEDDYLPVKHAQKVAEACKDTEDLIEKIEGLENELEELEESSIEERIEDKEMELEEIEETEAWNRKQELEDRISDLREEKKELEKKHSRNASVVERGLKKLIYNVRNQGLAFKGSVSQLEALKKEEFEKIDNPKEDLQKALNKIQEEDILGERQAAKFSDATENFEEFEEERERMSEIEEEIESLEEELEGLEVTERKKEIERKLKDLKNSREDEEERIEELLDELEDAEDDLEASISNLEEFLGDSLHADVTVQMSRD